MDEVRRRRYALAGAMAVTVAELMKQSHTTLADVDDAAAGAVGASVHSAAAACASVAARLLIFERDATRRELDIADVPQRPEPGVTTLDGPPRSIWASMVRAVAAAGVEVVAARGAWAKLDLPEGAPVAGSLALLLEYIESLAVQLEANEPEDVDVG